MLYFISSSELQLVLVLWIRIMDLLGGFGSGIRFYQASLSIEKLYPVQFRSVSGPGFYLKVDSYPGSQSKADPDPNSDWPPTEKSSFTFLIYSNHVKKRLTGSGSLLFGT
jgi:hypothetical protein